MLRIAFMLPFVARHPRSGAFFGLENLRLAIEFCEGPTPAQVYAADTVILEFCALASTGAMSGGYSAPKLSTVRWTPGIARSHKVREYGIQAVGLDDSSFVVLVDMVLRQNSIMALRSLTLSDGASTTSLIQDPASWSTYPGRYEPLPFEFNDCEPESGTYSLTVELAETPQDVTVDALSSRLTSWVRAILSGAYALAPVMPDRNYIEPDWPIVSIASTLEWTFFKFRAHPSALDGLVNILGGFSESVASVRRVEIS